jgi:hypothetical protein
MITILRAQSPATQPATLAALLRSTVTLVRSGVASRHPDWSDAAVAAETARRMARATTTRDLRAYAAYGCSMGVASQSRRQET